jgi:glycosyltransferase involved in cell wall biosynthesis
MERVHISVAMTTYNGSRFLTEQLESIATQTRLPDELVVCDDRSADDTVSVLERFAKQAPFPVRVFVNDRNLGSTKNFEQAVSLCEGDVIALSDQDDIWVRSRLHKTAALFAERQSIGLVFGNADIIDQNAMRTGSCLWQHSRFRSLQRLQLSHGRATQALLNHNVVTGATMAFRSKFREVILPIPETWVHDGWISLIISFFASIVAINEPLIQYRQHPDQQLGPSDSGLREQIAQARGTGRLQYEQMRQQYEAVYNRLAPHVKTDPHDGDIRCLCGKIRHLSVRAQMPGKRIDRVPVILRELASWRYMLYSRGLMSAVKDFMM